MPRWLSVACVLGLPASSDARMSLVGVDIPATANINEMNTWPLRGAGNVWDPPEFGSNAYDSLFCSLVLCEAPTI